MSAENEKLKKIKVRDSIIIHLAQEKMLQLEGIASGFGVTPEAIAQQWILKQLQLHDEPGKITHAMKERMEEESAE